MNRYTTIILIAILSTIMFVLGFHFKTNPNPKEVYQVYLNEEVIGVVASDVKMNRYIDSRGEHIKRKYNVETIHAPLGLRMQKIYDYEGKIDSNEMIYDKIVSENEFTIEGYQFTLTNNINQNKIYVIQESVFQEAIYGLYRSFVGSDLYQLYENNTQKKIDGTGSVIEQIYLDDHITKREVLIPVDEKIYTDSTELKQFLLFGTTEEQKTYKVIAGDTIESISFQHEISVEEFLISNRTFTNKNNLLFPGQEVVIGITEPQVKVVVEEYAVVDTVVKYQTEERFDAERLIGDDSVVQKGEDGIERITQRIKKVNGIIESVGDKPLSREEIKPTISQVVVRGGKVAPSVGSLTNWAWPTGRGWIISEGYTYRWNPVVGGREFHQALDITGTGHGSPIYAANNGTITEATSHYSYGNYIVINHNNGYYSLYAHMSKLNVKVGQVVGRGSVIGFMGSTGHSTGTHLHFEIWRGKPMGGGYRINPYTFY